MVKVGQKCRYKDAYGLPVDGEVLAVNGQTVDVYDGSNTPAQYNESFMTFNLSDIGTKLILQ